MSAHRNAVLYIGSPPTLPFSRRALLGAAGLSVAGWLTTERFTGQLFHRRFPEMLRAAQTMQAAMDVVRAEKERRGLMQPADIDPNRTGLIGPEWSQITTTLGILPAKRTATNPDFAAALVRLIDGLSLPSRAPVAVVASGSLVGANVAILCALDALGLAPILVSSLGASMYGATDLDFTWLDIEAAIRSAGVLAVRSHAVVFGAEGGVGRGLDAAGVDALRRAAERHHVRILQASDFTLLIEEALAVISGPTSQSDSPHLLVNIGGSLIGLGKCDEADRWPAGLIKTPPPCSGEAGLVGKLAVRSVPVLHILNMRRFAADLGLPYDPIPLPHPGEPRRIYLR